MSFFTLRSSSPVSPNQRTSDLRVGLGTVMRDNEGVAWVYIRAGAAIAVYDPVTITPGGFGAAITCPVSSNLGFVGVAQAAFLINQYGFIAHKGLTLGKVTVSAAVGLGIRVGAVAGVLAVGPVATDTPFITTTVIGNTPTGTGIFIH
jgi:hypothetical protein